MGLQQLQDRTLSASVTHIALCPNMRLLAVALDANSIAVFRVSWQRLATIAVTTSSPDELITSVAWSPTGAHIVATTSHCRLLTYSVDRAMSAAASARARRGARDTDPVASFKLDSPATAVLWTRPLSKSKTPYEKNAAALLPILLLTKSHTPHQCSTTVATESESSPLDEFECGFIFIGDTKGYLTILTSDLSFRIAHTCVAPSEIPISRLHITACGKRCVVIASSKRSGKEKTSNDGTMGESIFMRIVDLKFLRKFHHEIERVAQEVVIWNSFLKIARGCVEQIEKAWSEAMCGIFLKSIVRPLHEVMQQYAEDVGNVWDDFFDVFCGARVKGSLLHFLNSSLGENGAKELLRAFEVHDNEAMDAFQKVLPFAENAVSMASELLSLAHVTSRFAPVGIGIEDADRLFNAASKMYDALFLKSEELRVTSNEPSFFLYWIVITARKLDSSRESAQQNEQLGGWETQCILKFFEKMTGHRSKIAANDEDKNMNLNGDPEGMDHSSGAAELSEEDHVKTAFDIKLRGYVDEVERVLQPVTEKPSVSVSSKLRILAGLTLENWIGPKCCVHSSKECGENNVTAVFTGNVECSGEIMVVKYKCSGKGGWNAYRVRIDGGIIHDVITSQGRRFIMVVEDKSRSEEYSIEVVSRDELGLIEAEDLDPSPSVVVKTRNVGMVHVKLMRHGDTKIVGSEKQKINGFKLSENEETGLLSLLAMPKRVALFELANDDGDKPEI